MHQEQYWMDQGRKNVSKPYVASFFMWVNEQTKIIKIIWANDGQNMGKILMATLL